MTFDGQIKSFNKDQIKFFYRGSDFGEPVIISSVKLKGSKGKKNKYKKNRINF